MECIGKILVLLFVLVYFTVFPATALANGGAWVAESETWQELSETRQIAIITIIDSQTARIDLFVSLEDKTGESNDLQLFVPLGKNTRDFTAVPATYDEVSQLTGLLDAALDEGEVYLHETRKAFLWGTYALNGPFSVPFVLSKLFSTNNEGRAAYIESSTLPEEAEGVIATAVAYETGSSSVDVNSVNPDTSVDALLETTAPNPRVDKTLERYRDQPVAVIGIKTNTALEPGTGIPGLHLSWLAEITYDNGAGSFSYPLGTGSAWANPIEETRVYIVAPENVSFDAAYPELGEDLSGFEWDLNDRGVWKINVYREQPAFAVESASGYTGEDPQMYKILRVTYLDSNSAEDIVITVSDSPTGEDTVPNKYPRLPVAATSLAGGCVIWLLGWRYLMPLVLGIDYRWRGGRYWRHALFYLGMNIVFVAILYVLIVFLNVTSYYILIPVVFLTVLYLGIFSGHFSRRENLSRLRLIASYIAFVVAVDLVYICIALGAMRLIGVI